MRNAMLLRWTTAGLSMVVVLASQRAAAAPPMPKKIAVLAYAGPKTPARIVDSLRAVASQQLGKRGMQPVPPELVDERMEGWAGAKLDACVERPECMFELSAQLKVDLILVMSLRAEGGKIAGELRIWHLLVDPGWRELTPQPRRRAAAAMASAIEQAKESFARAWSGNESEPTASGAALPPLERIRERAPEAAPTRSGGFAPSGPPPVIAAAPADRESSSAVPVGSGSGAATAAPAGDATMTAAPASQAPEKVSLVGEEDGYADPTWGGDSRFGFQIGAAVELFALQHRASPLGVGRDITALAVGTAGVGAALRFRIPALPLDELYVTLMGSYAFDDPLLAVSFGGGVEKRWALDRWFLGFGGRYVGAVIGLPVPQGSGTAFATSLSHGGEGYAAVAVNLDPAPLQLQLELGYRGVPLRLNQFSGGGQTYFTRDPGAEVWVVDLSGPMARLVVVFAWESS